MRKVAYYTRGNADPRGKQRVFLACHPADASLCAPIAEELLALQDCVIWHWSGQEDAATTEEMAELYEVLGRMQLLVIPVTARFLREPCAAEDIAFAYATAHHVPVLPLLQQRGIEAEFNRVCGNLQFLDKNTVDVTAIPYEEKLKNFLSSVLLGDEEIKKVRAAFDAYIFLSYRKKDREHARRLMQLIHKNEFCRDVAIWYDEFLTPGENFNDAIGAALRKSELFALVVTPNLVNEENYVMRVEYPMARTEQKPILPLLALPTDREALSAHYDGLPALIDTTDEAAVEAALRRAMDALALGTPKDEPMHLFCIGLAYLGGIDVETDHERALGLIERAAEAGLAEAMEKLVSMYRKGEGVALDRAQAVRWQECLTECLKAAWKKEPTVENARRLTAHLLVLGEMYDDFRRLDDARGVYLLLAESEELIADFSASEIARIQATTYRRLGEILLFQGKNEFWDDDPAEAEHYLRQAKELCNQEELTYELALIHLAMAKVKRQAPRGFEDALEELREAARLAGLLEPTSLLTRRLKISIATARVDVLTFLFPAEACAYGERMLVEAKRLADETEDVGDLRALAYLYDQCGHAYGMLGGIFFSNERKNKNMRRCYEANLHCCLSALEKAVDTQAYRDVMRAYHYMEQICEQEGNKEAWLSYHEKCFDYACRAVAETGTIESFCGLGVSFFTPMSSLIREDEDFLLGSIEGTAVFRDVAGDRQRELTLQKIVAEFHRTPYEYAQLAAAYRRAGEHAGNNGHYEEARAHYEEGVALCQEWLARLAEMGNDVEKEARSIFEEQLEDIRGSIYYQ